MAEYRVRFFDALIPHDEFRALLGGPAPAGDDAKIALMEHLWDQPDARYQIRRLSRSVFPLAPIPYDSVDFAPLRMLRRVIRALRAPSNVGRAPSVAAAHSPQGAAGQG